MKKSIFILGILFFVFQSLSYAQTTQDSTGLLGDNLKPEFA